MPRALRTDLLPAILISTLLLTWLGTLAEARQCFDYATSPHWISTEDVREPRGVAVQDGYAYVGTADSALVVVDVTDVTAPQTVAHLELDHAAGDIELAGSILYLANDDGGLAIIDISLPAAPALLAVLDTPGSAFQVTHADSYVYVADFSAGVQVVDVSQPSAPAIVATLAAPGFAYAVAARGSELLVGHGHGLLVADISDPRRPRVLGNLPAERISNVAWMGDVVCASAEEAGFYTIDVSNPQSPVILGSVPVPRYTWAGGITVDGTTALVSVFWDCLWGIECANPRGPKVTFRITPYFAAASALQGNHLFAADDFAGLAIFDLADRARPVSQGGIVRPHGGREELAISGAYLFALQSTGWFDVFDVSGAPRVVASLPVSPWADDLAVGGNRAYVGLADPGIERGGFSLGGMEIIDISHPSSPGSKGKLALEQRVSDIAMGPSPIVFLLTQPGWSDPSHLYSVDVADPDHPRIVGSMALEGYPWGMESALGRLFIYGQMELLIADVGDPSTPRLTGELTTGFRTAMAIDLPSAGAGDGPYAYLSGQDDLAVVDLSNPDAPVLIQTVPAHPTGNLTLAGDLLYASHQGGVTVFDLTQPAHPILLGASTFGGDYGALSFSGFTVDPPSGDLLTMTWTTLERWPGFCGAAGRGGATNDPVAVRSQELTLGSPLPNPSGLGSGPVALDYTLSRAGTVRLEIWDASGRLVRRLLDTSQVAGQHRLAWDGRNESRANVASGVYFIRLEANGETATTRILRVR